MLPSKSEQERPGLVAMQGADIYVENRVQTNHTNQGAETALKRQ